MRGGDRSSPGSTTASSNDIICLSNMCQELYNWCECRYMKLNVSKCKILSLGRPNNVVEHEYRFITSDRDFVLLDQEYLVKNLRVLIDQNLTFDENIHEQINVASKMLGII